MSSVTLRNGRSVGDFQSPYVVAELNTSHFGDMAVARSMIDQAKAAGCDCVKFQSWSEDTLYSAAYYRENAIARRFVKKFALAEEQLLALAGYCDETGIDFASTPYSRREAEFLVEACKVPFVKIASMELNNLPFLAHLGRLGVPLVMSTGMGTRDEILRAVRTIEDTGNRNLIILHCTSVYPAPDTAIRLQNIAGLRGDFPDHPIGYSDHSTGIEIAAASIALGACLVEKHFTLDASRIGMDNQMAMEPQEMAAMVAACRRVHAALGGTERVLADDERAMIPKMRRSVVTARALPAGHVLEQADLDAKRPGTGIPPDQAGSLVGRRLKTALGADEPVLPGDLEAPP
jgi:sialic acid synthase SpsE